MHRIQKVITHTHTQLPFESIAMDRADMRLILIALFVIVDMAFYHLIDLCGTAVSCGFFFYLS